MTEQNQTEQPLSFRAILGPEGAAAFRKITMEGFTGVVTKFADGIHHANVRKIDRVLSLLADYRVDQAMGALLEWKETLLDLSGDESDDDEGEVVTSSP